MSKVKIGSPLNVLPEIRTSTLALLIRLYEKGEWGLKTNVVMNLPYRGSYLSLRRYGLIKFGGNSRQPTLYITREGKQLVELLVSLPSYKLNSKVKEEVDMYRSNIIECED